MTHIQTVDRIIELSEILGYGIDVRFDPKIKTPIKIKPIHGRIKSFSTLADALIFLEARRKELLFVG